MNLKTTSARVLAVGFGALAFIFLYLFFRFVFDFWLSDFFVLLPTAIAAYLMTNALIRSKANNLHKFLTGTIILVAIGALTMKLMGMQIVLSKVIYIINN